MLFAAEKVEGINKIAMLKSLKMQGEITFLRFFETPVLHETVIDSGVNKKLMPPEFPLVLIGILIFEDSKSAWIRTHDDKTHHLELGKQIPGSKWVMKSIRSNSVELADLQNCETISTCDVVRTLSLNFSIF